MKTKQILLIVVLLALLIVGWLLAMQSTDTSDAAAAQEALVEQGDKLAAKELYIRAIPKYEEALGYEDMGRNDEIERKLLDAYLKFNLPDDYLALVTSRAKRGIALESEYLQSADIYVSSLDIVQAMSILELGMQNLGRTDKLHDAYEACRYMYTASFVSYEEILPPRNGYMRVKDVNGWGFANTRGRIQFPCVYEYASDFNAHGIAIVKQNGEYKAITNTNAKYGIDDVTHVEDVFGLTDTYVLAMVDGKYSYYDYDFLPCAASFRYDDITLNACGYAAVKQGDYWGVITDSGTQTIDFVFEEIALNERGSMFASVNGMIVGAAKNAGKWYLIDPDGGKIIEEGYAGLRAPEGGSCIAFCDDFGKWGFINLDGEVIISCKYDDARSFSDDLAAVKLDGEWMYISVYDKIEINGDFTSAGAFVDGTAIVETEGGKAIINLEKYE